MSAARTNVSTQRNEAKAFLLQFIQKQNNDPALAEAFRKRMIDQYSKVDTNASDIEKIMDELTNIQNAIFTDLDNQTDISAEKLEMRFQAITEKMQALTSTTNTMNENVSALQKISMEGSGHKQKNNPPR